MSENKSTASVKHEVGVTVRLDWNSLRQLDDIALYEREKRAPMMRRILVEKIKVYEHNPAFKRYQKSLESKMEKKEEKDPQWK